ncbi:MAG: AlpA family phage regulatory protein, partial [Magnetospirillum sp.]|nr:AlpA family phage regulatory protein [Magnetospirillum sp.]
ARLEAAGQFPHRVKLGLNRVAWLLSEVDAGVSERIGIRDASVEN